MEIRHLTEADRDTIEHAYDIAKTHCGRIVKASDLAWHHDDGLYITFRGATFQFDHRRRICMEC